MSIFNYTILKEVGQAFALRAKEDTGRFDDLWEVYQVGNKFRADHSKALSGAVDDAYAALTDIVAGRNPKDPIGLSRVARTRADKLVVFSDHHMTDRKHRHDYFRTFNFDLYLAVLRNYGNAGYTLVENGDVEELVIFEPTSKEAERRRKLVRRPTLGLDDVGELNWDELAGVRLETRIGQLERILSDNAVYYDTVRTLFGKDRYLKVTGNHDRYSDSRLTGMIETAFWPGVVHDTVLVDRPIGPERTATYHPRFVLVHGHQFDEACSPAHAAKVGETISECLSWAFQGPDRIWRISDTQKWTKSGTREFSNVLSAIASKPVTSDKKDLELFLECLMSHEIAWEYFENKDPYMAFVKEVCTGDEFFKYRHMDEDRLANALLMKWKALPVFPSLICGHTHEPRDRATFHNTGAAALQTLNHSVPATLIPPDTTDPNLYTRYLNTGSAGRFENLIWGVEINGDTASVVSWTNNGTSKNLVLKKTIWTSNDHGKLLGRDSPTASTSTTGSTVSRPRTVRASQAPSPRPKKRSTKPTARRR